jgi:hypothetical protein
LEGAVDSLHQSSVISEVSSPPQSSRIHQCLELDTKASVHDMMVPPYFAFTNKEIMLDCWLVLVYEQLDLYVLSLELVEVDRKKGGVYRRNTKNEDKRQELKNNGPNLHSSKKRN